MIERTSAHLFVADIDRPVIDEGDEHHIARVLRIRSGDDVSVSDGAGGWRMCRLGAALALEPTGEVERAPRSDPLVQIAFALVKGDRPEWTVQKLTELGVDRISPMITARSVVRWDGVKAMRQAERLARIGREAAMQSRQRWLPTIDSVTTFEAIAGTPRAALATPAGDPLSLDHPTVLIGPEGGWTPDEEGVVATHVTLGPAILRSETAAIAAGVLLCALRAGIANGPRGARSD